MLEKEKRVLTESKQIQEQLQKEMRVLTEENNALLHKNNLLLENNVSNLAKLQLKLERVEKEKSLIEKERDDNDEALVELNQKLQVLEKLRKEDILKEANNNRNELEETQKQLSLTEEDLKMAQRKIKDLEKEMSTKHQSDAKTLLEEELIQEMNKEYERRLTTTVTEADKKLAEEKEKVKNTTKKLYEAKFEAEREILLKNQLDEAKKQLDEKEGLKAKLNSIESLHKDQMKEVEANHRKVVEKHMKEKHMLEEKLKKTVDQKKVERKYNELLEKHNREKDGNARHLKEIEKTHKEVIDRYKTEMEKNEKFVEQGKQEMKILTNKYTLLLRKIKSSQRILSC